MAKYKVKVIAHQLKNNVIAKFGDVVDEIQLNGNAEQLVKDGFIESTKDAKEDKKEVDLFKMKKDDLITFAKENEIELDETLTNKQMAELIELEMAKKIEVK